MQLLEIQEKSNKLIEEIKEYQADRTKRATEFIADLTSKRGELEDLQKSVNYMKQNCSITEILEQREEKTKALRHAGSEKLAGCNWEKISLKNKGKEWLNVLGPQ